MLGAMNTALSFGVANLDDPYELHQIARIHELVPLSWDHSHEPTESAVATIDVAGFAVCDARLWNGVSTFASGDPRRGGSCRDPSGDRARRVPKAAHPGLTGSRKRDIF
jgi:hypothetical protein